MTRLARYCRLLERFRYRPDAFAACLERRGLRGIAHLLDPLDAFFRRRFGPQAAAGFGAVTVGALESEHPLTMFAEAYCDGKYPHLCERVDGLTHEQAARMAAGVETPRDKAARLADALRKERPR